MSPTPRKPPTGGAGRRAVALFDHARPKGPGISSVAFTRKAGFRVAENQAPNDAGDSASNRGGLLGAVFGGVAKVWNAVMADGHLEAAWRQGINEVGTALKAFPDSIGVDQPGTLWNPTQGEIAADRNDSPAGRAPWPSEIASQNRNQPVNDNGNGNENGHDAGYSM
jgi:hypothetical protein